MFAGIDSESVFSVEPSPTKAKLSRSKSDVNPASSSRHRLHHPIDPFVDPVEAAARVSYIEEEFGWSGSVGGIRGRDDRQIERDVEYERKMAERTKRRHKRNLARQQQALGITTTPTTTTSSSLTPTSPTSTLVSDRTFKRPVFAPTEGDLERVDLFTSLQPPVQDHSQQPQSNGYQHLSRGKSLRDKVEAALGRFNSVSRKKATRSQSVSAIDHPPGTGTTTTAIKADKVPTIPRPHLNDPPMVERKEGLGALARRISKKLTIEDRERRRRERLDVAYAEPPLLSHTLVGAASPFPMRPALSTLVPTAELKYGEAHTDYSPNPFRRRNTNHHQNSSSNPNKLNLASNHYQSSPMRS